MTGQRKWLLLVDSGSPNEPGSRYFGRLERAVVAWSHYPMNYRRFGRIVNTETGEQLLYDGQIVDEDRFVAVLTEEEPGCAA